MALNKNIISMVHVKSIIILLCLFNTCCLHSQVCEPSTCQLGYTWHHSLKNKQKITIIREWTKRIYKEYPNFQQTDLYGKGIGYSKIATKLFYNDHFSVYFGDILFELDEETRSSLLEFTTNSKNWRKELTWEAGLLRSVLKDIYYYVPMHKYARSLKTYINSRDEELKDYEKFANNLENGIWNSDDLRKYSNLNNSIYFKYRFWPCELEQIVENSREIGQNHTFPLVERTIEQLLQNVTYDNFNTINSFTSTSIYKSLDDTQQKSIKVRIENAKPHYVGELVTKYIEEIGNLENLLTSINIVLSLARNINALSFYNKAKTDEFLTFCQIRLHEFYSTNNMKITGDIENATSLKEIYDIYDNLGFREYRRLFNHGDLEILKEWQNKESELEYFEKPIFKGLTQHDLDSILNSENLDSVPNEAIVYLSLWELTKYDFSGFETVNSLSCKDKDNGDYFCTYNMPYGAFHFSKNITDILKVSPTVAKIKVIIKSKENRWKYVPYFKSDANSCVKCKGVGACNQKVNKIQPCTACGGKTCGYCGLMGTVNVFVEEFQICQTCSGSGGR